MIVLGGTIVAVLTASAYPAEPPLSRRDPAPPRFHPKPADLPVPGGRKHRRVIVYRAPGPLPAGAVAGDWPRFLGPAGDGVSPETHLAGRLKRPADGKTDPMLLWTLCKGESYAAPSVAKGRVVCFHRRGNEEIVECLDAEDGRCYWSRRYPTGYRDRFNYLDGPRATPAIDGGRVYTLGAEGVLLCLDRATGHRYWKRDLAAEFALDPGFFGVGTSPLIEGDLLILNLGAKPAGCVAAFEKRNGRLRWLSGRRWGRSYATPAAATVCGRRVVFVFAGGRSKPPAGGLLALDPASGRIFFRYRWRSPRYFSANASNPVVFGDRVFVSTSYDIDGAMIAVGPGVACRTAYKTGAFGSHWMTPILRAGYLYGFSNDELVCMEWATGKKMWGEKLRLPGGGGNAGGNAREPAVRTGAAQYRQPPGKRGFGFGSLIRADGRFICLGETGLLALLDLSPEGCRVLSSRRLFTAGQAWTAPVLSRGLLYVAQNLPDHAARTPPRFLCYDLRGNAGER